jgi:hypothetical protein
MGIFSSLFKKDDSELLSEFTEAVQLFNFWYKKIDPATDIVEARSKNGRKGVDMTLGHRGLLLAWSRFTVNKLSPSVNSFYTADFLNYLITLNSKLVNAMLQMDNAFRLMSVTYRENCYKIHNASLDIMIENIMLIESAVRTSKEDAFVWNSQIKQVYDAFSNFSDPKDLEFYNKSINASIDEVNKLRECVASSKVKLDADLMILKGVVG